MILGKVGEVVKEPFTVLDNSNNLVSGISTSEFTAHLFTPNDVDDSTSVIFSELSNGHYYAEFTPNQTGTWMLVVYHPTYFPWGKSDDIQVYGNDFDSVAAMLTKVLGLVQENFYIDNNVYDSNNNLTSSRVRIYSNSASVGTDDNVLETYIMTATYDNLLMTSYKMEKQ